MAAEAVLKEMYGADTCIGDERHKSCDVILGYGDDVETRDTVDRFGCGKSYRRESPSRRFRGAPHSTLKTLNWEWTREVKDVHPLACVRIPND